MRKTAFLRLELPYGHFSALWAFSAPWAHPAWPEYTAMLYDLRISPRHPKANVVLIGATHEFMLYALDPTKPYPDDLHQPVYRLNPPNMAYQFTAVDDDAAVRRIQTLIDMVEKRQLSPDTDHRRVWDELFKDGATLISNAFSMMQESSAAVKH